MEITARMIEAAARVYAHRDVFNADRWREYAETTESMLIASLNVYVIDTALNESVSVAPEILDPTGDDAATINGWSDRNPATIIRRTAKTITVQRDRTEQMTAPENVESGAAFANGHGDAVIYLRDADAPEETFTLRKNGRWIATGAPTNSAASLTLGHRSAYRDPHF